MGTAKRERDMFKHQTRETTKEKLETRGESHSSHTQLPSRTLPRNRFVAPVEFERVLLYLNEVTILALLVALN